ncbi:MAG: murein hydrolase activator EnvC family protein [Acutalibacteraceae bacterium]
MKNNAILRLISLALLTALLFCTFSSTGVVMALSDEEKAQQLENEIKTIQQQIDANKDKIAELRKKADGQQQYIDELQTQVDSIQAKIRLMNNGIARVQSEIDEVDADIRNLENQIKKLEDDIKRFDNEIIKKQQEIAQTYTRLGRRIRALYLAGPTSDLELILSSGTFEYETFLAQVELLNRISEHDNNLVLSIKQGIEDIKKMQEDIKQTIKKRDADVKILEQKKAELNEKKTKQVKARQAVQAEEEKVQADMNEILGYVGKLNSASAQYKRINESAARTIQEYERRIVELLKKDSSTGSGTVSSGMIWPVQYKNTYISSSFKMRTLNGVTRQHNGIDICVSGGTYGKTISASAAGKVIAAYKSGYNWGYGLYVVIDHGNGVQTYYCHCSSVRVSVGQNVSKGQAIASIGDTGYSFGAHLHFGVLVNDGSRVIWVNPLRYVNKPSDCQVYG